jgi:hypothetical protein
MAHVAASPLSFWLHSLGTFAQSTSAPLACNCPNAQPPRFPRPHFRQPPHTLSHWPASTAPAMHDFWCLTTLFRAGPTPVIAPARAFHWPLLQHPDPPRSNKSLADKATARPHSLPGPCPRSPNHPHPCLSCACVPLATHSSVAPRAVHRSPS